MNPKCRRKKNKKGRESELNNFEIVSKPLGGFKVEHQSPNQTNNKSDYY